MNFPISIFSKKVQAAIQSDKPAYESFTFLMAVASIILGKLQVSHARIAEKSKPVLIGSLIGQSASGKNLAVNHLLKMLKGIKNQLKLQHSKGIIHQELVLTSWNGENTIIQEAKKDKKIITPFCHISAYQMCLLKYSYVPIFRKTLFVFENNETINQPNINIKNVRKVLKAISRQTNHLKNQKIYCTDSAYKDLLLYQHEISYMFSLTENQFLKSQLAIFPEYALRFALIFEVLAYYEKENIYWTSKKITQKSTKKAIQLMRYFQCTSQRIVRQSPSLVNGFEPRILYAIPEGA